VVRMTTAAPAAALRRGDELGSLAPGREADVTVLELARGARTLVDGEEASETAAEWLEPRWVVRAGEPIDLRAGAAAEAAEAGADPAAVRRRRAARPRT